MPFALWPRLVGAMPGREGALAIDRPRGPALLPSTAVIGGLLINRGSTRHWLPNPPNALGAGVALTALKEPVER